MLPGENRLQPARRRRCLVWLGRKDSGQLPIGYLALRLAPDGDLINAGQPASFQPLYKRVNLRAGALHQQQHGRIHQGFFFI